MFDRFKAWPAWLRFGSILGFVCFVILAPFQIFRMLPFGSVEKIGDRDFLVSMLGQLTGVLMGWPIEILRETVGPILPPLYASYFGSYPTFFGFIVAVVGWFIAGAVLALIYKQIKRIF